MRTPAVAIRLPVHPPVSRPSSKSGESNGGGAASLFAGIRRSSCWSLLEDSGETSFSNRNDVFRFEEEAHTSPMGTPRARNEEEPPSNTEFAVSRFCGNGASDVRSDEVPSGGFFSPFLFR